MGRTSFDGPVYGALGILAQMYVDTVAVSQTDLENFEVTVPADEDWYVTRIYAYTTLAGTAAATVDVEDDTVSLMSANITLVTNASTQGTLSPAAPRIAASSAVTFDVTTGATTAPLDITVTVEGYRRYIGAPRGRTNPL